jgi:2-dehydro-3-deoxygalactonokinase
VTDTEIHDERPVLVGVDWGSTRLRAYLLGETGNVLAQSASDTGILTTHRDRQAAVLHEVLEPWLAGRPDLPVVAAGMIGSRSGLVETTPVPTPATASDVAAGVSRLSLGSHTAAVGEDTAGEADIVVSPGLVDHHDGHDDLIRGEEAQILGWLAQAGSPANAVLILPGTHSKWISIESGAIQGFHTFPTGELFATLQTMPSLVGATTAAATTGDATPAHRQSPVDAAARAFRYGVEQALTGPGLLHPLFALRVVTLAQSADRPYAMLEHLSGLLIGREIREAAEQGLLDGHASVVLISDAPLGERYRIALEAHSIDVTSVDAQECVIRGLAAIHANRAPADLPR